MTNIRETKDLNDSGCCKIIINVVQQHSGVTHIQDPVYYKQINQRSQNHYNLDSTVEIDTLNMMTKYSINHFFHKQNIKSINY